MVPKEWIAPPPDHETAEGELLLDNDHDIDEEEEDDEEDENAGLVQSDRKRQLREEHLQRTGSANSITGGKRIMSEEGELPPARVVNVKKTMSRDEEGRELPAAERAPLPNSKKS